MQGALHTQAFLSVLIKTDMLYLHEVCNCFRSIKHTINWIKTHKTKQAYFLWFFFTLLRQITQGLSITDWSLKYAILIYQLKAIRLGIHILLLQRLLSIYFAHNGIWNNANNEEKGPQVQWQLTLLFSPPGCNGWSVWGGAGLAWPGLVVGDVDGPVALDEVNVALQLLHLQLQTLFAVLLGSRVRDDREALVLMMQLIPVLFQTLRKVNTNKYRTEGSQNTAHRW